MFRIPALATAALAASVLLAPGLAHAAVAAAPDPNAATPPSAAASATGAPAGADASLIARGKYLATIGDCAACHTANGGQKFAGGQYMKTPFGSLPTPNITPDKATGIGNYTDAQFYKVLHNGIAPHVGLLYPVMPYPWYTRVSRADAMAIKAYLFSLAPVHKPRLPSKMQFPYNVRAGLAGWRLLFFTPGTFKPNPKVSAQINRGAYLVEGLGHCGECHNGRGLLGNSSLDANLQGGPISQWYAPNITSDVRTGIGGWTDAQIVTYLQKGVLPGKGVVAGPMAQTVHESLRKMKISDLQAIAAYLKSTPPKSSYKQSSTSVYASANPPGAQVYLSYCSSCHQTDGHGIKGVIPSLVGNGAVLAKGPQDIIRVVLGGIQAQGDLAPMPAFGAGMSDQQIAAVTNYVRTAWTNKAPPNAGPQEVASLRADTRTMLAGNRPKGCPALVQPGLKSVIQDPSHGITPLLQSVKDANMIQQIDAILAKVKQAAPQAKRNDIVNSLTVAYCPLVYNDKSITPAGRSAKLGQFATLVYGQLAQPGATN